MALSIRSPSALPFLSLIALSGCEVPGGLASAGTAPAIADEGEFPPECGTANATSDTDAFAYSVADLDGCNDIQSFTFNFTWDHGPVFAIAGALAAGSVEVRITPEGGDPVEATIDAEHPDDVLSEIYTDCDDLEAGVGPGTVAVRLLLSEAEGTLNVASNDDTQADAWYFQEMCGGE